MRITRTTLAIVAGVALFAAPPVMILSSFLVGQAENIEGIADTMIEGAGKLSAEFGTKQLVAGILLFLIVFGFIAGVSFYLLMCFLGIILVLILRELHEIRGAT